MAHEDTLQPRNAYSLFLAGIASWFTSWGLQQVMLQWLVVQELHETPARVGTAQMALLSPALLLLLVGGALADRIDVRRALVLLHVLAALTCSALAATIHSGVLEYSVLVGYALVVGCYQAFVLPTRDVLLSEVVQGTMGRAVAGLTVIQHIGMGLGALIAGLAGVLGAPLVLLVQAAVLLAGVVALLRLSPVVRHAVAQRPLHLRELKPGVVEVARSKILRPIFLLNVSVGLVFVSTYVVLLPLLVREQYAGGPEKLAILVGGFPLGTVAVTLWIGARGGLARPGRAQLLGQGLAGACVGSLALGLPYLGALAAIVGWGIGGAFAINASRTLFQEHASRENRGRVLSVYSLAVLGAGPLGAFATGHIAEAIGTPATLALHGTAMVLGMIATYAFTDVRNFR